MRRKCESTGLSSGLFILNAFLSEFLS